VILAEEQADQLLDPYRPLLLGSLRGAHEDWSDLLALRGSTRLTEGLSARTRSGYIHDRSVNRLHHAAADGRYPGFRMVKIRGLWVAILRDQMVLKIKKLDKTMRSRNIATLQTRMFDVQAPLISAASSATNATTGYVADRATGIAVDFVVVCWDGRTRHWHLPLDKEQTSEGGITRPVVPIGAGPAGSGVLRRRRTRVVEPSKKTSEPPRAKQ
jgi:hypothetical protein